VSAHDEPPSAYAKRVQAEREEEARAKRASAQQSKSRFNASFFDFSIDFSGDVGFEAMQEILRAFEAASERRTQRHAPPPPQYRPAVSGWRAVLGFAESARPTLADAKKAYRARVLAAHPDHGGSHEKATALNLAWERARKELGGQ
jgi:hypothetical protein